MTHKARWCFFLYKQSTHFVTADAVLVLSLMQRAHTTNRYSITLKGWLYWFVRMKADSSRNSCSCPGLFMYKFSQNTNCEAMWNFVELYASDFVRKCFHLQVFLSWVLNIDDITLDSWQITLSWWYLNLGRLSATFTIVNCSNSSAKGNDHLDVWNVP